MSKMRFLGLAVIALILAGALASSGRVAQAQPDPPDQVAQTLQIYKFCEPEGILSTFEVRILITVDVAPFGSDTGEDEQFSEDFTIDCEEVVTIAETGSDVDLSDFFTYVNDNLAEFAAAQITLSIFEINLPPWWTDTYFSDQITGCAIFQVVGSTLLSTLGGGVVCTITNTLDVSQIDPNFVVTKSFDGDPVALFTYRYNGPGCIISVEGGDPEGLNDNDTFQLANGETAELWCTFGANIITEEDPSPSVFESVDCGDTDGVEDQANRSATLDVGNNDNIPVGTASCTFTNSATGDDPGTPDIDVTKVCVGEGFDATFEITISDAPSQAVECDGTVSVNDLLPGTYPVSETISGPDADGFTTVIVCSDGAIVDGTSTTVTIPETDATDISCVIVNGFAVDVGDLVCPCPCGCIGDIEIDLDNTNTNAIGIENENENENTNNNANDNENNNTNTNTQDQTNDQNQDNNNSQTNNITSSPEVNIDFDDKH
jgi:hypothetical protein